MKYLLGKTQVEKAKLCIKKLRKEKRGWIEYKHLAERDLKNCLQKHEYNIRQRIKEADKQIKDRDRRIQEFKDVIKKGYITI